ncbi:hypothetical protein NON00_13080 [Roseomonas sp. GC11]|uniref:phage tail assembly chaperone n=1 Tax=Roseomonas sp. GC11 TaxID=2950546 RepID=UPI00210C8054|nr:hypothetical protein [Roseomonas sp. GC11]MCQ4160861.1 hypothetical protein [Roseomonas sp. GC11]
MPFPEGMQHVWNWFLELDAARGGTGFGPLPLQWGEIHAWMSATGARPTPWELNLIRDADAEALRGHAAEAKEQGRRDEAARKRAERERRARGRGDD